MNEDAEPRSLTPPRSRFNSRVEYLRVQNRALRQSNLQLQQQIISDAARVAQDQYQAQELLKVNEQLVITALEARDLKIAADEVNRLQTVFLSMLAHELRNPLAAIAVANSILDSLNITHPRAAKLLAIIRRQITHLMRLTDDLLDASRIASGKISLKCARIALSEVIGTAVETVLPLLEGRAQTIQIQLPPSVVLLGDLVRLSQLFANLLANASKFSAKSTVIVVMAHVRGDMLEVIVKDRGRGIDRKYQAEIFNMFSQGPEAIASAGGGLGIGLALVKTIAEMHGGSVRVESDGAEMGSVFIVTLPLPPSLTHESASVGTTREAPVWSAQRMTLMETDKQPLETITQSSTRLAP